MANKKSTPRKPAVLVERDRIKNPICIWVDPDINGVRLTRDLSMVGLKLSMDKQGCTWLQREPDGWIDRLDEGARIQVWKD